MALQLRKGQGFHIGKSIVSGVAALAIIAQPLLSGNIPSAFAADGIDTQSELEAALADSTQTTIDLTGSFSTDKQINITRSLTLNGNGFTITPAYAGTGGGNDTGLAVTAGAATITNVIIDGNAATNTQGIQIWHSAATLTNVAVRNNDKAGIHVNSSTVTLTNVNTANNGSNYGGIMVSGGTATINGVSQHAENTNWTGFKMDVYRTGGTVVDTNGQYTAEQKYLGYISTGIRTLKPIPAVPTDLGFTAAGQVCGGSTNVNYTQPTWGAVAGVASYDYQALYNGSVVYSTNFTTNQHPGGTFGGGENGVWGFQVRSVGTNGMKSAWSPVCSITLDTIAPALPTLESPANNATINYNSFWFEWSDATGATSYEAQFSQSDSVDSATGSLNSGVWAGDASHNQPTESRAWSAGATGTWYWQVRAIDDAGNKSAWTTPWKLTIDLNAPSEPEDPTDPTEPTDPTDPTDPETPTEPTGSETPLIPGGTTDDGEQPNTDTRDSNTPQLFTRPLLASNAVLGDQTTSNATIEGQEVAGAETVGDNQDVKGSTDVKQQGNTGFAWYWWIAILGGLLALWLIIAAISRRVRNQD